MEKVLDKIDFKSLPNAFVMKCSHGCKWHYIIKDKDAYLANKKLVDITKRQMTGWLEQEYWAWGGFEMQYKYSFEDIQKIFEGGVNTELETKNIG